MAPKRFIAVRRSKRLNERDEKAKDKATKVKVNTIKTLPFEAKYSTGEGKFSTLPNEVILEIFKWIKKPPPQPHHPEDAITSALSLGLTCPKLYGVFKLALPGVKPSLCGPEHLYCDWDHPVRKEEPISNFLGPKYRLAQLMQVCGACDRASTPLICKFLNREVHGDEAGPAQAALHLQFAVAHFWEDLSPTFELEFGIDMVRAIEEVKTDPSLGSLGIRDAL